MKYLLIAAAFFSFSLSADPLLFGEPVDESQQIAISTIMASPDDYVGKTVTIEGAIVGVCSRRGCWVELASDARFEKIRLKVRDGDMVFPMHAKGRKAIATGKVFAIELSLNQTRSYLASLAKRDGEEFDPESVSEPMSIYQVEPIGVKILD